MRSQTRRLWTYGLACATLAILPSCRPTPAHLASAPVDSLWLAPRRPRLPPSADTNAASAYENWGIGKIGRYPDSAAAAFYWASRLDPWRASPYYERGVALVLTHAEKPEYAGSFYPWAITRQLSIEEISFVDSLNQLALLRDPFLERPLDRYLSGAPGPRMLSRLRDPAQRGYVHFALGAYDSAVANLGKALAKQPEFSGLRMLRAISFYYLERFDSTAAELQALLTSLTERDEKRMVRVYHSKAMLHYAMGIALVQTGDSTAREHFEQALVEDLSFYMARVRLAGLSLARGDTAAAIDFLAQAVELKDDDPALHYFYGVLQRTRDRTLATAAFERSIALDPVYAPPYMQLGLMADVRGDTATAIKAYDRFIALSARDEPQIPMAQARRQALVRSPTP